MFTSFKPRQTQIYTHPFRIYIIIPSPFQKLSNTASNKNFPRNPIILMTPIHLHTCSHAHVHILNHTHECIKLYFHVNKNLYRSLNTQLRVQIQPNLNTFKCTLTQTTMCSCKVTILPNHNISTLVSTIGCMHGLTRIHTQICILINYFKCMFTLAHIFTILHAQKCTHSVS